MRDLPFKQKFSSKRFLSSDEKAVEFSDEILFGMSLDPPWQLALSAIAVLAPMPMSELATPLSFFISKELRAEPCHILFVLWTVLDNIASSEGLPVRSINLGSGLRLSYVLSYNGKCSRFHRLQAWNRKNDTWQRSTSCSRLRVFTFLSSLQIKKFYDEPFDSFNRCSLQPYLRPYPPP